MIESFGTLPIIIQIFSILGVLLSAAFILWVGAKYGLRFKGKDFSLSFGKTSQEEKKSPHSGCENGHDALSALEKVREIEGTIFEYNYQKRMRQQMDHVESAAKQSINMLLRIYTSLLSQKGKANPIKTESCQSYLLILKILENRLIDKMRDFMRENHLAEKSEQDFDAYCDSRSKDVRFMVTETLNDLYHYDRDITRAELYDANEISWQDFQHLIRECFMKCRIVAVDVNTTIESLKAEIAGIFQRFIN